MDTRRQFLAKAAFLSGAATFSGSLLSAIERASAIEPDPQSTFWDAEHVVILMQENRSFDHAFGTLRGVRGFNDPRAITLTNGRPVWVQTDPSGKSYAPFRLNINDTNATWLGCLPHGWTDQVDARNEGRYDRWLEVKRSGEKRYADLPLTLGYYTRDDIPFYYALADAFTICDQHFCSSLTGTTPNRCYLWTGTIHARQSADSWAHVLNQNIDHDSNVSWPTFPERLEDLGVSWKVYQNEVSVGVGLTDEEDKWLGNFGDNPLEYFTQYNVRLTPAYRQHLESLERSLPQKIASLQSQLKSAATSSAERSKLADSLAECSNTLKQITRWNDRTFDRLTPREKSLLSRAFVTNVNDPDYHALAEMTYRDGNRERRVRIPKGDLFHQFRRDVTDNALPTVSWVAAPEHFSDHPSSAWFGAWYIAELLDILTQNPEVWKKTIFILTYDENDGYFDHVPPFVVPDPRRPETGRVSSDIDASLEYVTRKDEMKRKSAADSRDSSIGLGYRVPLIVASPWSRGGFVCSQVFDHTSSLQFLEKLLSKKLGCDVRETNISQWRRTVCGDLTSVFQPGAHDQPDQLNFPPRDAFVEQIDRARYKPLPAGFKQLSAADIDQIKKLPAESPAMPRQEPGVRPSCALPYELAVEGTLDTDKKQFQLSFTCANSRFGKDSAGSPFAVYARYRDDDLRTRNYAVSPGDHLQDSWPLNEFANERYHLAAYGPNGFYREFQGDASDPPLKLFTTYGSPDQQSTAAGEKGAADIFIHVTNLGQHALNLELMDLSYKSEPQTAELAAGALKTLRFNGERSFGWYDITLQIADHEYFVRRWAGRVETGRPSFSDPTMGKSKPNTELGKRMLGK